MSVSKQPKGVGTMFILQILSMFGFYMIYALIVLYCVKRLGFSTEHAYAITAAFNALNFALSVPGGYFAQRFLGYKFATFTGLVLSVIGLFIIMIQSAAMLYIGLGFFLVGMGMAVPALFVLLGWLYDKDVDNNVREFGFMLAYMGINVGAMIASPLAGTLANDINYSSAFLVGAIFTIVMIFFFIMVQKRFKHHSEKKYSQQDRYTGLFLTMLIVIGAIVLVEFARVCNILLLVLGAASIVMMLQIARKEPKEAGKKLLVFLVLNIISVIFWALYALSPSALTIFTEFNVNRIVFGMHIPAPDFQSLNPFFIITLGPLITFLWIKLAKWGFNATIPFKFAMGVLLMGIGYLVLVMGIDFQDAVGIIGVSWVVLSYFFQTVGELMIGPVGFSMVGLLVRPRHEGLMMGIWQLTTGVGAALSEFLANLTTTSSHSHNPLVTDAGFLHGFLWCGLITVVVALFSFLLLKKLNQVF